jgi:circadian clock protein KaiB
VLYSAGNSPKHESALRNLQEICRDALGSAFDIDIVDVTEEPERAREDQILAIPTVVRVRPQPERRVVGDLSQRRQVVLGLELPRTTEDALGT